jgi:squalene monooxygenase
MPNSFLPASAQGGTRTRPGVIILGDAWNMRHPLTGGGMSVALHDVCVLSDLLRDVRDLGDWQEVQRVLSTWWWRRKGLAATINVLSVALYDLFGAEGA